MNETTIATAPMPSSPAANIDSVHARRHAVTPWMTFVLSPVTMPNRKASSPRATNAANIRVSAWTYSARITVVLPSTRMIPLIMNPARTAARVALAVADATADQTVTEHPPTTGPVWARNVSRARDVSGAPSTSLYQM